MSGVLPRRIKRDVERAVMPLPGSRVALYAFNRPEVAARIISRLEASAGGPVDARVLVNVKAAPSHERLGGKLLPFSSLAGLLRRFRQLRGERLDAWLVVVTYVSFRPSFLLRLALMYALAAFSRARVKLVYDQQDLVSKLIEPSYVYFILSSWLGRKTKAFFLMATYPFWEMFFSLSAGGRRKRAPASGGFSRALVIQLDLIGDYVWSTPCYRALKESSPDARVDLLTSSANAVLAAANPFIESVINYDIDWFGGEKPRGMKGRAKRALDNLRCRIELFKRGYDLVVDLRGDPKTIRLAYFTGAPFRLGYADRTLKNDFSFLLKPAVRFPWEKRHEVHITGHNLNLLRSLGLEASKNYPELFIDKKSEEAALAFLGEHGLSGKRPLVVVHPGASRPQKLWGAEKFARLADLLTERFRAAVVFTGSRDDQAVIGAISGMMAGPAASAAGKLGLQEFAALLKLADMVITAETATIGMATAAGTPMVAIMSGVPALFGPMDGVSEAVVMELDCRNPIFEHCYCEEVPYGCLEELSVERVAEAAGRVISKLGARQK